MLGVIVSAVGINCSPGLTHIMGPSSLLLLQDELNMDRGPQGIDLERKGLSSSKSKQLTIEALMINTMTILHVHIAIIDEQTTDSYPKNRENIFRPLLILVELM